MRPRVQVFDNPDQLSLAAAEYVRRKAAEAVAASGRFTVVLAGGGTPRPLYETLARPPFVSGMPWRECFFFWGDERFVDPGHPESNYGMAARAMLDRAPVPGSNVFPMPTSLSSPPEAALSYEKTLARFFGIPLAGPPQVHPAKQDRFPRFDLVLLGLGEDGHTASLFPGEHVLDECSRWVAAVQAPESYRIRERITLTLPVLNAARAVAFLVTGKEKKEAVGKVLHQAGRAGTDYPASRVQPAQGELVWFLDRKARGENAGG